MEYTLTTPAIIFSAISLLLLAYTNRFLALAALIRELHRQYRTEHDPIIIAQIKSLKYRVNLIKNMQVLGVASFFMCTASMLLIFAGAVKVSKIMFAFALVALMVSLVLSLIEMQRSCDALDMRLKDIEKIKS